MVELHAVGVDGTLGPTRASATALADGSFSIPMPTGSLASGGGQMLVVRAGADTLRAYLHGGPIRVDASSEAWVRQVAIATGRLQAFPDSASPTLKAIARSLALFSDSTGQNAAGQTFDQSVSRIVTSLQSDRAMGQVLATLASTGALPVGVGDIGGFFALSDSYAGQFLDDRGASAVMTLRGQASSVPMAPDGSWSFRQQQSSLLDGQLTPVAGAGSNSRLTPDHWYTQLTGSGIELVYLSNAIGEYPQQSFPLQAGARQLDARRITQTRLNFTGGNDEQPIAFATTETVSGVESVTIAAGTFRAVRIVDETHIVLPRADGTVQRIALRATMWVVSGVGVVKEIQEGFVDGVAPAGSVPATYELSIAYANGAVWPSRMTMTPNFLAVIPGSHRCVTPAVGARRFVAIDNVAPAVNGTPRLALSLWNMDTGQQIGATRLFEGNAAGCPVSAGMSGTVFVAESFDEARKLGVWPTDAASARASSDVVHQVNVTDLSDVATYRVEPVADSTLPALYHPAWAVSLFAAPDTSGRFVVGTAKWTYFQPAGGTSQSVQLRGPGIASSISDLGTVLLVGADWEGGRLFTSKNSTPFAFASVPFGAAGADPANARTLSTNSFVSSLWYVSQSLAHLPDGSTIRLDTGAPGPRLPFTSDVCGTGSGVLVCLDGKNDRLIRYDPDTLTETGHAVLGSYLRSLANVGPVFNEAGLSSHGGIPVLDASTFVIGTRDIRIGHWQ